ncbi:hypothetical protein DFH11DRAFT_1624224 [Phellopilus nigrolimitatus]|nr:hypothetical protein DFH11DRAFT_1624224 [Phellopilus nigrolimitatus]
MRPTTSYLRVISSFFALFASCRAQATGSESLVGTVLSTGISSVSPSSSTHFTPDSPSSSFDSSGTGVTSTSINIITEPTYASTITSCFSPPTGTVSFARPLDASSSILPAGAECYEIIHSSGLILEETILSVAADGQTSFFSHATSEASSSSSGSSKSTGTIIGAVIGSVFGALFVGAVRFCRLVSLCFSEVACEPNHVNRRSCGFAASVDRARLPVPGSIVLLDGCRTRNNPIRLKWRAGLLPKLFGSVH